MADENDLAVLRGDGSPGDGHVISKRGCLVLDDGHVVPVLLEDVIDTLPAGAVGEGAMNEYDVLGTRRRCLGRGECGCGKGDCRSGNKDLGHFAFSFYITIIIIAIINRYAMITPL